MKTKFLWLLLMIGFTMGSCRADEKRPLKHELPSARAISNTGQQTQHTLSVPLKEKDRKNPVRFTELSVARGKTLFQSRCVLCHGMNADGKGDFVGVYGSHPPDFTKPEVLSNRTDGELFYIISTGSEKMPGKRTQITEKERWDIVNYLRAVEGNTPAKTMSEDALGLVRKLH